MAIAKKTGGNGNGKTSQKTSESITATNSSPIATSAVAAAVTKTITSPTISSRLTKTLDARAIAQRAYYIWKNEGCPEGKEQQHWLQAEKELTQGK